MADIKLSGGDKLMRALADIAANMGGGRVDVGFINNATYPKDGTPVAAVAFWNEFGDPARNRPPRPFFRQMITKESPDWAAKMAKQAKLTNYDGGRVLGLMGTDVQGALMQSIVDFTTPALSPVTVARKGNSKPLIDTKVMLDNVTFNVEMD